MTGVQTCALPIYRAIVALNGEEAYEIFRERHNEIKGVILDLSMPDLSGKDVFIMMQKVNPEVKVILTSGFGDDDRVRELFQMGICDFIQKPFSVDSLTTAINKVV